MWWDRLGIYVTRSLMTSFIFSSKNRLEFYIRIKHVCLFLTTHFYKKMLFSENTRQIFILNDDRSSFTFFCRKKKLENLKVHQIQDNRGDMLKIHVTAVFRGYRSSGIFFEKTKNRFLDMVQGSVCTKFQVCIVFRLVRTNQQSDRPTYIQVN